METDADTGASAAATITGATTGSARSATIYDVARLAGVSHQTVSRHLRGIEGIRPATRERVVNALEALDYRPNMTARHLATNRSHRVGVLTHESTQVGPSRMLQGASEAAREAGYLIDAISLNVEDPAAVHDALRLITRQDIAGLLVFASTDAMASAIDSAPVRVPTVIEADKDEALLHEPASPDVRGLQAVIDHLVALGHRRFFHIAGPAGWVSARNRELSYERALRAHGVTSLGITRGDWSAASGFACVTRLPLELGVTALVASNDQMALGALLALERRGVRVPHDMSVTGFDDIPEAEFFRPPLTTIRIDHDSNGRSAFDRLMRLIDGSSDPGVTRTPAELIVRESTAAARDMLRGDDPRVTDR